MATPAVPAGSGGARRPARIARSIRPSASAHEPVPAASSASCASAAEAVPGSDERAESAASSSRDLASSGRSSSNSALPSMYLAVGPEACWFRGRARARAPRRPPCASTPARAATASSSDTADPNGVPSGIGASRSPRRARRDPVVDRPSLPRADAAPSRRDRQRRVGDHLVAVERARATARRSPTVRCREVRRGAQPHERALRAPRRRQAERGGWPGWADRAMRRAHLPVRAARARARAPGGAARREADRRRDGGTGTAPPSRRGGPRTGSNGPAPRAPPSDPDCSSSMSQPGPSRYSSTEVRVRNSTRSSGRPSMSSSRRYSATTAVVAGESGGRILGVGKVADREGGQVDAGCPTLGPLDERVRGRLVELEARVTKRDGPLPPR